ncbi:acyltransferase family protein [Curtobacterium sp. 1P10AnD]|uniref:acyltransferase family protein n=1 Tax=Curtobacterium sp. 1P10AnD TaxID=3132283 RepID=UPI0039A08C59
MTRAGEFRTDVNALRALSVLIVVTVHAAGLPRAGWLGVDVFFVISGYLIARSMVRERIASGHFALRAFAARRFWRLLPAALVTIVVVVIVAAAGLRQASAGAVAGDGAAAALGVANFVFLARDADYWAASSATSPFQHFWSLSVELQFYVVFPVLLLAAWRVFGARDAERVRALAVGVGGTLGLVSAVWAAAEGALAPGVAYFDTGARLWELALGSVLGAVSVPIATPTGSTGSASAGPRRIVPWPEPGPRARTLLVIAGFAVIGAASLVGPASDGVPMPDALPAVVGAALVLVAGDSLQPLPLLRWRPVQLVGDASYSIYLWHYPAVVAAGLLGPGQRVLGAALGIGVGVGLGILSRLLVEQPGTRMGRRSRALSRGVFVTVSIAAVLAVGSVATATPARTGPDDRVTAALPDARALSAAIDSGVRADSWPHDLRPGLDTASAGPAAGFEECAWTDIDDPASCRFGDVRTTRSVTVVGSSVGTSLMPAVVDAFAADAVVRGLTAEGCPMIGITVEGKTADDRARCNAQRAAAVREINRARPDVVIVTHSYDGLAQQVGDPPLREAAARWYRAAAVFADRIRPSDAAVVFVAAAPQAPDRARCAALRWARPSACATTLSEAYAAAADAERLVASERAAVHFVDSSRWYCDAAGACPAIAGDVLIREDGQHITREFAHWIAGVLRDAVTTATAPTAAAVVTSASGPDGAGR